MATSTSTITRQAGHRAGLRTAVILVIAIAIATVVNAGIAGLAVAAGAPADYGPLTPPAFASFTVLGVLAGWVGWVVVRRRARDPRRVLRMLVPVVAVLTFVPDLLLLALGFIPGTTTAGVLALMAMHLAVLGFALPSYVLASRAPDASR